MRDHNGEDRSITAQGMRRDFGGLHAVDGVDLEIPGGRIFGFLGPNGAGKSTLVKILTTILNPTAGRATVAGYDVQKQGGKVRKAIGVALQDVGLDPLMTARELLMLQSELFGTPRSEARKTAERLLATVGLDDVDPKKRSGAYSGGMKRRLDLALALVNDPRILFLDEPTTGLDPASRAAIWEEVRRLNDELGMTIFLTTQYLEEADRLADEVAIISKGKIVAQGTPSDLKREVGDEVVELQFGSCEDAASADDALAAMAPSRQHSDRELRLYFGHAAENVPKLVRVLDGAGIRLQGLTIEQPSLDDVFLRVTGEALEHEVDEAGDGGSATPASSAAGAPPPGDNERAEVMS
ncbi:MAG: ATP-binding cassette domain-containing protein [Actinobacteria bacterium]|nr:ATP-binding cassette domain-containing protein [Actinomycetota bacterium]